MKQIDFEHAKEIECEMEELGEHLAKIEKGFCPRNNRNGIDVSLYRCGYGDSVRLRPEFLSISPQAIYDLYALKVGERIKELRESFEKL